MYSEIVNPLTGEKVSITSKLGKSILRNYLMVLRGGAAQSDVRSIALPQDEPYNNIFQQPIFYNSHDLAYWLYGILDASYAAGESPLKYLNELLGIDDDEPLQMDEVGNELFKYQDSVVENYDNVTSKYPNFIQLSRRPSELIKIPSMKPELVEFFLSPAPPDARGPIKKIFTELGAQKKGIDIENKMLKQIVEKVKTTGNTPVIAVGLGEHMGAILNPIIIDNIISNDEKYDFYIIDRYTGAHGHLFPLGAGLWKPYMLKHRQAYDTATLTELMHELDKNLCNNMLSSIKELAHKGSIYADPPRGARARMSDEDIVARIKKNITITPIDSEFNIQWISYLLENLDSSQYNIAFHDGIQMGGLLDRNMAKDKFPDYSNLHIFGTDGFRVPDGALYSEEIYKSGVSIMSSMLTRRG